MARKHQLKKKEKHTNMKTLSKWLRLQLVVLIYWLIPDPQVVQICLTITLPIESMFFTAVHAVCAEVSEQGYILRARSPAIKFSRVKPAGKQLLDLQKAKPHFTDETCPGLTKSHNSFATASFKLLENVGEKYSTSERGRGRAGAGGYSLGAEVRIQQPKNPIQIRTSHSASLGLPL